ncbi:MAG: homoserine O-acetyltransferase, partial [Thermoanaerobaculia bacterium]
MRHAGSGGGRAVSFHLHISPETRFLRLPGSFLLDSGERLREVEVAYRSWGRLSAERDNAVVVCHALTGSADVDRWWGKLLGGGRAFDPEVDFVLAANLLGSCYGTTGPRSPRTPSGAAPAAWGGDFPAITVRDQVRLQQRLLDALGVARVRLVVGGSLGGMVALEWALLDPGRVEAAAVLSAPARHGPWGIALSELGRRALLLDPKFRGGHYPEDDPPVAGLALARSIAMTSYRSRPGFEQRFGRDRRGDRFEVTRYLEHQGKKLVDRFDANSYLALLGAMDSHDLARGRGSLENVLRALDLPVLVLSSTTDVLYPVEEQLELATLLPGADYVELASARPRLRSKRRPA